MGALFYLPALESHRPVKEFCRIIQSQSFGDAAEAGFFRTALPSMVFYLRHPIFQESSYAQMTGRFQSAHRVFCILNQRDYSYFAERNVMLYILGRHSRFALRLSALFNAGYLPEEQLLLVSNRPSSLTKSSGGRPAL